MKGKLPFGKGEPMKKLVWRVKLVADFGDEAAEIEVEVARIERDEFTVPETLGLSLAEGKVTGANFRATGGVTVLKV